MKSMVAQHLPGGRRFPASSGRILLLGLSIALLYAAGLAAGGWAATLSLASVRAGREVPWAPWLLAFACMVSGMLSVVYGFFFRPRALEISGEEAALVKWDGKGRSIRREAVTAVRAEGSRLVVEGGEERLVIARIFTGWDDIRTELESWAAASGR